MMQQATGALLPPFGQAGNPNYFILILIPMHYISRRVRENHSTALLFLFKHLRFSTFNSHRLFFEYFPKIHLALINYSLLET
jgi:hypothetical protein